MTFEIAMNRLEEISQVLSKNQVSIDESLKLYAEGAKLISFCSEKLSIASNTIDEISNKISEDIVCNDE